MSARPKTDADCASNRQHTPDDVPCVHYLYTHTHTPQKERTHDARTHASTHTRTRARTHTHTHAHTTQKGEEKDFMMSTFVVLTS